MILEWRRSPHGDWWAYCYWTGIRSGFKGGIDPRQSWFHQDAVQRIAGVDYSRVPRLYAQPEGADAR